MNSNNNDENNHNENNNNINGNGNPIKFINVTPVMAEQLLEDSDLDSDSDSDSSAMYDFVEEIIFFDNNIYNPNDKNNNGTENENYIISKTPLQPDADTDSELNSDYGNTPNNINFMNK